MSHGACNCCEVFSADVDIECRTVGAICEYPDTFCYAPYSFPSLGAWDEGCRLAWDYLGTSHHGAIIASNFAAEEGFVVEGSYFDQRHGEWRFSHEVPITCYLKIWYRVWTNTFADPYWTPPIGDSESYTDHDYTWAGTGNPCLPDPGLPPIDPANREYSTPVAIGVPGARTAISVEIIKYSYVDGYEPDISDPANMQPNGFPNPDWEPAPP